MDENKRYDINKRKYIKDPTVEDLINELQKLPKCASVSICGANDLYVHISKDDSIICLDTENLQDDYDVPVH